MHCHSPGAKPKTVGHARLKTRSGLLSFSRLPRAQVSLNLGPQTLRERQMAKPPEGSWMQKMQAEFEQAPNRPYAQHKVLSFDMGAEGPTSKSQKSLG